jgi:hypothetical protein
MKLFFLELWTRFLEEKEAEQVKFYYFQEAGLARYT